MPLLNSIAVKWISGNPVAAEVGKPLLDILGPRSDVQGIRLSFNGRTSISRR